MIFGKCMGAGCDSEKTIIYFITKSKDSISSGIYINLQVPPILSEVKHEDGKLYWDGSGRNAPNCGLDDLRGLLASTEQVAMAQG